MQTELDSPAWLGIDLGTQSVRAVVLSGTGRLLGQGSAKFVSRRDGPRHEQDPESWWQGTRSAVTQALAELDGGAIRALAVDGTSGTILLADAQLAPRTAGLMYDDVRATAEAEEINATGAEYFAGLGYGRMQPAWALPKLLWLHRYAADKLPGAALFHQSDYVNARLAGRPVASDLSNALKTGCDLIAKDWPARLMTQLGIDLAVLPRLAAPGSILGTLAPSVAQALGLSPDVAIIAGMTDSCAAQLGAGALAPGAWNCVLGTTLALKGATPAPIRDAAGVLYCHRGPDGLWLPGGASSSGAGILARDFAGADLAALSQAAAARRDPAIFTYPLAGRGERFPFVAPEAESFCSGVPTDEVEHFASVLLGLAFVERLCFDLVARLGAPIDGMISFTGGGAGNDAWTQLRADVLGRPVFRPEGAEPATGMARLAAAGWLRRPVAEIAAEMPIAGATTTPDSARLAALGPQYLEFLGQLQTRGWIEAGLADFARRRIAA
jgi:sugar (pentulose or hexulose) kinase